MTLDDTSTQHMKSQESVHVTVRFVPSKSHCMSLPLRRRKDSSPLLRRHLLLSAACRETIGSAGHGVHGAAARAEEGPGLGGAWNTPVRGAASVVEHGGRSEGSVEGPRFAPFFFLFSTDSSDGDLKISWHPVKDGHSTVVWFCFYWGAASCGIGDGARETQGGRGLLRLERDMWIRIIRNCSLFFGHCSEKTAHLVKWTIQPPCSPQPERFGVSPFRSPARAGSPGLVAAVPVRVVRARTPSSGP